MTSGEEHIVELALSALPMSEKKKRGGGGGGGFPTTNIDNFILPELFNLYEVVSFKERVRFAWEVKALS